MSQHVADLMDEYVRAREAGKPLTRDAFLSAHPEEETVLRVALDDFLLAEHVMIASIQPLPPEPTYSAGTPFGDLVLNRKVGAGAMGVVYEADEKPLSRRVAVKVMNPHRPGFTRERFLREATLSARLKHDGIASVHSFGEHRGTCFFVMDLIRGAPLDAIVTMLKRKRYATTLTGRDLVDTVHAEVERRHGPRSPEARAGASTIVDESYEDAACRMIARVADALAHAHENGVIHRDVKPSNILIRDDGSPVLTDFGLAIGDNVTRYTRTGDFAGTPLYASPEQAEGQVNRVDARSDVFSLGVTLYELLALRRPFKGGSLRAVLTQIKESDPPPPRRFNPRVTPDLDTIVMTALAKRPERRYASAAAFAADLRRHLAREPIDARPPSWLEKSCRVLARHAVVTILVLAIAGGLWSGWRKQVADERLRANNVLFAVYDAIAHGKAPAPDDVTRFAALIPDEDVKRMLLRDPRDLKILDDIRKRYFNTRSGNAVPPLRAISPRLWISERAPRFRFAFAPEEQKSIGPTAHVVLELTHGDDRFTIHVERPSAGTIEVPLAEFAIAALTPGEEYFWTVDLDPKYHRVGSISGGGPHGIASFTVATDEILDELRHVGGTRDSGSDEILRAAFELGHGLEEDALRRLRALPADLDPMLRAAARNLEAKALGDLRDEAGFEAISREAHAAGN